MENYAKVRQSRGPSYSEGEEQMYVYSNLPQERSFVLLHKMPSSLAHNHLMGRSYSSVALPSYVVVEDVAKVYKGNHMTLLLWCLENEAVWCLLLQRIQKTTLLKLKDQQTSNDDLDLKDYMANSSKNLRVYVY